MSPITLNEIKKSTIWALVTVLPVSIYGWVFSMAIAHSNFGYVVMLLYWPAALVMELVDQMGFRETMPEWLFATLALSAQFLGYLFMVLAVRALWRVFRQHDI